MPRKPPRDEARLASQRQLGARIRQVREEIGWTQREAAEIIGFRSNSAVSNLENGLNGVDAIDLWAFARASHYPMEFFVNPEFNTRAPAWPRTLLEWNILCGHDRPRAEAHYAMDRAIPPGSPEKS